MPPFIGRKRNRSPEESSKEEKPKEEPAPKARKVKIEKRKPTLLDTAGSSVKKVSLEANKRFLEQLDGSQSSSSSLSDADSEDFEDVLPATSNPKLLHGNSDSDEEIDWEDALATNTTTPTTAGPLPSGDLELTLNKEQDFSALALTDGNKKGPSKIERQIRISTHCAHVQFLMFHNLIRSGWACDEKAQKILVEQLPQNLTERVEKWRVSSGITSPKSKQDSSQHTKQLSRKGKGKGKAADERKQRDWGSEAVRLKNGAPNPNQIDTLPRLLKELVNYWKRHFRVTAPALRKQGYKAMNVLQEEMASFNKEPHDAEKHGERIRGRAGFRHCARVLEGSRDVGVQLFTCLLRGLGIQTRLVASLQPVGFGWAKSEEAPDKKSRRVAEFDEDLSFEDDDSEEEPEIKTTASLRAALESSPEPRSRAKSKASAASATPKAMAKGMPKATPKSTPKTASKRAPARQQPIRGSKDVPIALDSDDAISIDSDSSVLSDAKSVTTMESVGVIEPASPRRKPNMPFDRDMKFPNTWVEAISPLTNKVIPVDPMVTYSVATEDEHLAVFEPRGKKADQAKQVLAYVIAYNADGTAKDVTTRYLKRHQWPGKTKGMRIPVEKVPIYNRRGKVKRYEQYDWFKTVISGYTRSSLQLTEADELEDQTGLKPLEINRATANKPVGEIETLSGYKQSAEFVLERFLRRDEALVPHATPVRHFTPPTPRISKASANNAGSVKATAKPEPVYRRADVVSVKTAESWHKEGRGIIPGSQPLKSAPIRAVTLVRKREVEEATRQYGVAPTQGLYSKAQTDWIVPDPIVDGVIPKNAYGTIDVFVPRMVPRGARHVPYKGAAKACKKLGCDFAEAVVGFEFGNRRAVPVNRGVVVASEWAEAVVEEVRRDAEEKRIKEDGKRAAAATAMWRKFVMGLRIVERVRAEYGPEADGQEERNPFVRRKEVIAQVAESSKTTGSKIKTRDQNKRKTQEEDAGGGGFVVEEPSEPEDAGPEDEGGGFLEEEPEDVGGGFVVEEPNDETGGKGRRKSVVRDKVQYDEDEDAKVLGNEQEDGKTEDEDEENDEGSQAEDAEEEDDDDDEEEDGEDEDDEEYED